ncbi:ATP-binding protein [Catellatospora tritici]|uniref:ATP-binding protein n=1 Tax=Catellatospora tritici TaxID=2851566 RepID=UPI001C2D661A|nr:ATP-binding protein [Catellatospora tritici]MBV1849834.1 ATP-binding protein [Catellatospora tritici]
MTDQPARDRPGNSPRPDHRRLLLDLRFAESELVGLRAAVAAHASEAGMPDARIDVLVFIAYELATNAVRHGGGHGRLRLWGDGDAIACQVIDAGSGPSLEALHAQRPGPGATGGRGLWLVRTFSDSVEVEVRDSPDGGAEITALVPYAAEPE